jgi:hypothetical protein
MASSDNFATLVDSVMNHASYVDVSINGLFKKMAGLGFPAIKM